MYRKQILIKIFKIYYKYKMWYQICATYLPITFLESAFPEMQNSLNLCHFISLKNMFLPEELSTVDDSLFLLRLKYQCSTRSNNIEAE